MDIPWAALEEAAQRIRENDSHVVVTVPANQEAGLPGYSYTAGAMRHLGFELIICGLGTQWSKTVLDRVVEHCIEDGMDHCACVDRFHVEGADIRRRLISRSAVRNLMPVAVQLASDPDRIAAWQLMWSDKNGNFPDEPRFHEMLRPFQPLL